MVCQRRADDQKPQGRKTAPACVRRAGTLGRGGGQPCSSLTFRTGAKLERPATRRFLLQFAPPYRGATGVERSTRMLQLAQSKLERKRSNFDTPARKTCGKTASQDLRRPSWLLKSARA